MMNRKWLVLWVILLASPALYVIFYWPLFTDEVAWKWIAARFFLDNGIALSLYPQCQGEWGLKSPLLFLPANLVGSLVYGSPFGLFNLRLLGMVTFGFCGWVYWLISKNVSRIRGVDPVDLMLSFGGVALLGVLPFVLVMNRPEQILLLCLLIMIWLPFLKPDNPKKENALVMAFLMASTVMFAQHAKTLFFLPLILHSCWSLKIVQKKRNLAMGYVLLLAAQCYLFFTEHTQCENGFIRESLSKMMVSPAALVKDPITTIRQLMRNGLSAGDYIKSVFIVDEYPNQWLPTNYGFHWGAVLANILIQVFFGAWIIATGWGVVVRRERHKGFLLTVGALGLGVVALALVQTSKNFYEAGLVIPLLIVMGIHVINPKVLIWLRRGFFVLATLSLGLVGYRFWPHLRSEWSQTRGISKQEHSVNVFYQKAIAQRIVSLAKRCDIQNEPTLKHVVLDDLTYPYFMKIKEPYHAVYVLGWWGKMSIPDTEFFLKGRASSGVIAQCSWLPEPLLKEALRDEDLCCVPSF